MSTFLSILISVVCFLVFLGIYWLLTAQRFPKQIKAPQSKPTMFDVRRLLREGQKDDAIRLYGQIFKVSAKQARKDVEELQRSLNV